MAEENTKRKAALKTRVNKNEFLERIATRTGRGLADVHAMYDEFVGELQSIVCNGQDLSLTGFGTFSLRKHKGHPVQFEAACNTVEDYVVLKFTASDVLMSKIRSAYSAGVSNAV